MTTADIALVDRLFETVARFRRVVRRHTARRFPADPVTQTQAELLRLVGRRPGLTVGEAAQILGLAANSVSTVVGEMERAGYLVRTPAPEDHRIRRLSLTVRAQHDADAARDARHETVQRVIAGLSAEDRRALVAGLDVLRTVVEGVDGRVPDERAVASVAEASR